MILTKSLDTRGRKSYTNVMPKHDLKIYGTAVIGAKGQFVVPADARSEMNLGEGDKLVIVGSPSKKFIGVLRDDVFQQFLNFLHVRLEKSLAMADSLDEFDSFAQRLTPRREHKRTAARRELRKKIRATKLNLKKRKAAT